MEREDYRLLPIFAVGLTKGVWETYIQPQLTAERIAAFAGGLALGILIADNELI